jgi:hypothetical protein
MKLKRHEPTMSAMAQLHGKGLLRGVLISFILGLVGIGVAIAMPPKATSNQGSEQPNHDEDLVSRVERLEALCGAAKAPDASDQKALQFLAQFYTAEYTAIMARISTWASLQYALFPILLAGFAILSKMDNWPVNLRLWTAIGLLFAGYLAYQGTMLDELQNVLLIERYLRPLASRVVGTDQFWIHERFYRQNYPANIFYWKYWPPLICLSALAGVIWYIRSRHGLGRKDYALAAIALLAWMGVLTLTVGGSRLEAQIVEACTRSNLIDPIQNSRKGDGLNSTVERTDTALSHGPAAARRSVSRVHGGESMAINYNAVASWSALAAAIVAIVGMILEGRRKRFSLGVDLILKLNEQFDSEQFRERRRRAAKGIREEKFAEAEEVFDFFDTVGMFTRRGALDKKIVWSVYSHWVYFYWQASKNYISKTTKESPAVWLDFKYLFGAMLKVERRESKKNSFQEEPKKEDVLRFLEEEEKLDSAIVTFGKATL